jgi:hypothetical protein
MSLSGRLFKGILFFYFLELRLNPLMFSKYSHSNYNILSPTVEAACVPESPGASKTGTPEILVFAGSRCA